jgi:hypothetical protein
MAVNETDFKSELRRDAREQSIFSVANSPEFNRGIPDLFFKKAGWDPVFVELKWSPSKPKAALCGLTALQANWIRDYRAVGGYAMMLIGWKSGPVRWSAGLHFGTDPDEAVDIVWTTHKDRGKQWDIASILDRIISIQAGRRLL